MKRYKVLCLLSLTLCLMALASCDMKWDENGDLDGLWQLTEWHDAAGQAVSFNKGELYYSFQLKLVKLHKRGFNEYYLSHFSLTGDSLFIGRTVFWPAEEERPLNELAPFGVPADGRFAVDVLSSDCLVLSSREGHLSFRKY